MNQAIYMTKLGLRDFQRTVHMTDIVGAHTHMFNFVLP